MVGESKRSGHGGEKVQILASRKNFNRRVGVLFGMNQELLQVIQQRQDVIKWCQNYPDGNG